MTFNKLFFLLLVLSQSVFSVEVDNCSSQSIERVVTYLKNELNHSKKPSISFKSYSEIDDVMMCDIHGKLNEQDKKKVLNVLNQIKKSKPTPFVWASSAGVDMWYDDVSKLTFLPQEIRKTIPVILSQLNSSIIAFVPSDVGNNSTYYNFESDLGIDLFSPWDRRSCGLPNEDILDMEENLKKNRISDEASQNFTRNYSAIEVSKIGVHKSPTCYWYVSSNKVECLNEFDSSVIHESLHFLETRYPKFINILLNANGGYKDRLKIAQKYVPAFGVTKCTRDTWEEYCDEEGAISEEQTKEIVLKSLPPQDRGLNAKRYSAVKLDSTDESSWCGYEVVKQGNDEYCVNKNSESLYTFVRGGEEYISVLLEKAIVDPKQFEKVASDEEKKLFSLLKDYIF